MKRVVVTGMSAITPVGQDWASVSQRLEDFETGIRYMTEWDRYSDLNTKLGAPVLDVKRPVH